MYVYVGNLALETSEEKLKGIFATFGTVESVRMPVDNFSGEPFGFAIIEMPDNKEAAEAIEKLDRTQIDSRMVIVAPTKQTPERRKMPRHYGAHPSAEEVKSIWY